MYKGTTPTFIFTFPPDFDPSLAEEVVLTFSANKRDPILEKTTENLEITSEFIAVFLTQQETLALPTGRIHCQINFVYNDGSRASTDIQTFVADNNLHNRVI